MDAITLAIHSVNAAAGQIERGLGGLEDKDWEMKINENTMSPRQMVGHLIECRIACIKSMKGQEHEWGTYSAEGDAAALMKQLRDETDHTLQQLAESPTDENIKHVMDFLALHDAYHVGQIVSLRLTLDPNWNSYVIYGM